MLKYNLLSIICLKFKYLSDLINLYFIKSRLYSNISYKSMNYWLFRIETLKYFSTRILDIFNFSFTWFESYRIYVNIKTAVKQ